MTGRAGDAVAASGRADQPLSRDRRHDPVRHARRRRPDPGRFRQRGAVGGAAAARWSAGSRSRPLVPVPPDHVLTKSFYLLHEFPGRWNGGQLWVEPVEDRVNDGVSSVIVGGNDWAGAWAVDDQGRAAYAVVPGGEQQREMAMRFGVNLVMYVLTGNYKSRPGPRAGDPRAARAMSGRERATRLARRRRSLPWWAIAALAAAAAAGPGARAVAAGARRMAGAPPRSRCCWRSWSTRRWSRKSARRCATSRSSCSTNRRASRSASAPPPARRRSTALTERLGRERDLDVRVVRAGKPQPGAGDDGTRLFTALNRALSDVPRQRLAGVVMITDGAGSRRPGRRAPRRPPRSSARRCMCCCRASRTKATAASRSSRRRASAWSARRCR